MRAGPIGITHRLPSGVGGSSLGIVLDLELASELVDDGLAFAGTTGVEVSRRGLCRLGLGLCSRLGLDGSSRLCTLGLINSAFALSSTLACGLLGSKTGATLGKGLLLGGRCRLGGILVRIGIVVGRSGLLGLDRGRRGLAHRIDNLGLNNGRHLFLRLAELTDGTADRAAHLRELIRAKQQKAEDHDDRELTLSNTKHTYLQGSM